jgi:hypothetical protein
MLDILTQKLQSCIEQDVWNSDDSTNPDLFVSPKKDIIIEWTDTGYFEVQKEKIMFNDCSIGHTHCLRKNGTLHEWTKFQLWYLEGIDSKLFRCDAPLLREDVPINEDSWDYSRWMRPGEGVGTVNIFNPATLGVYLNEIIDPYYNALAGAIKIAKEHGDGRIPSISLLHGLKDDQGYYFTRSFDLWDQEPNKIIQMNIDFGKTIIQENIASLTEGFKEMWSEAAAQKWNKLL